MAKEYRIVEAFGRFMNLRWELQEKYRYFAHPDDNDFTEGWHLCCAGSREFCEEALRRRINNNN